MENVSTYTIEKLVSYGIESWMVHIYFTSGEIVSRQAMSENGARSILLQYVQPQAIAA